MAEHPSFTLAALLPLGGTVGFLRTRSAPSLIAGVGLGVSYAYSGYLIKENKDYGTELALGNSILLGSAVPRIIKTKARAAMPLALGATGLLASFYYQKKVREFRFGV
ncbi:Uncharacterized protein family UPF0136, Transmembrane [Penicillium digitatum]|uniref:Transmembrane protein 14 n=3 Tax=Penicillium digitatum TaxID=36651 RepID=K9GD93_PEND2|nr:hypothetical protein PDIP_02880 [Penicillium digitatum Pd1]EKV19895.1 hypothetical protein PDIG_00620 [Penicillium digitatum PHI26]EKV21811.1 hypothetical protein PDIP_02880 [Penicillium digitatum Pd1]KAG0154641.1 hypothetical protein PDIDSM_209 [Penicillium digitatum]QQK47634.1 Uncharacterized protein family UPF0136, Transmembrane [Penicillium digitatum]